MKSYGQFCPVAMAMEVIGERWTLLIVRELMCGSHRFSAIQSGVPLMSKSVLAQRLRALCDAGVVERRGTEYFLTEAGEELGPIVLACGTWGKRWAHRKLKNRDVDISLLMWDMRRRINVEALPEDDLTVQFEFRGAPRSRGRYWLRLHPPEADLCLTNPGREVAVKVTTSPKTMAEIWLGEEDFSAAVRRGELTVEGPRRFVQAFPIWLQRSVFAEVELPTAAG